MLIEICMCKNVVVLEKLILITTSKSGSLIVGNSLSATKRIGSYLGT